MLGNWMSKMKRRIILEYLYLTEKINKKINKDKLTKITNILSKAIHSLRQLVEYNLDIIVIRSV